MMGRGYPLPTHTGTYRPPSASTHTEIFHSDLYANFAQMLFDLVVYHYRLLCVEPGQIALVRST